MYEVKRSPLRLAQVGPEQDCTAKLGQVQSQHEGAAGR